MIQKVRTNLFIPRNNCMQHQTTFSKGGHFDAKQLTKNDQKLHICKKNLPSFNVYVTLDNQYHYCSRLRNYILFSVACNYFQSAKDPSIIYWKA